MKVDEGGTKNYKNEFWGSPTVKKYAENKDNNIFKSLWCKVVAKQKCR
jgi:hypothetical protein